MLGTFQVQHVPSSLLDQLPALPSGHDKCHGHHPQGDVYDDDDVSPVQVQRQKKLPSFEVPPGGGASPSALTSTWAACAMMNATSVNCMPSSPLA